MNVRTKRPPAFTFGRYQLLERIPGPSLAERHRALSSDGSYVVLHLVRRELARDFAFRGLFQVQAAKARTLDHPNVARVVDAGEVEGRWYLAAEEVTGQDLATWIAALRGLGERPERSAVCRITRDVADALSHAHERGVVHGDVRPGNVIVRPDGAAVLTGFVMARSLRTDDRIAVGAFAPAYMAPELSEGKPPDARTDLYALGVLAYEQLTGRTPYVSETPLAVLLAHGREPLPLPSHVDPNIGTAVERVLLRALAVDPAARHPDPRSFVSSLGGAFDEDAARAPAVVPSGDPAPHASAAAMRRLPVARIATAGIALLAIGIVIGALAPRGGAQPTPTIATAVSPVPTFAPTPLTTPTAPPATSVPATPSPVRPPVEVPPTPLPRGALLYQAKLDGSQELQDIRVFSGGPGDAAIRITPGAIELEVVRPRSGAEAFFPVPTTSGSVGEFTVVVPSGSRALLTWALRRDGDASYLLRLDGGTETLSLVYDDGLRLREALAPQIRLGAIAGRPVTIAFRISGPDITVHVNGAPAMHARDARIERATLPPDIFVGDEGGVGVIRITSARLYQAQ